jgi:hypothetical protein
MANNASAPNRRRAFRSEVCGDSCILYEQTLVLRSQLDDEEIAHSTDSSVGTVRSRIHYGKEAFKTIWEEKTT